jgi:hypothetical protein
MNSASTPSKASQPASQPSIQSATMWFVCYNRGHRHLTLFMNSWKDLPTTFVDDDDDGSDLISPLLLSSVLQRRDLLQMTDDAG